MGMKAPAMQSICMISALGIHFSPTVMTMNCFATKARPNMAGKAMSEVKRSIFRNALCSRSWSVPTSTNIG